MSRQNRCDLIDESTVGVYHCINRCVRQAYLCGNAPGPEGKNYDHRRGWIQDRLEFLAGIFAIDVVGFSVMSNHFHLILRNRPDVVKTWPNSEVAQRWWNLFPKRREKDGTAAKARKRDLKELKGKINSLRKRISSISWLMRCLAEDVARRANREDEVTGHFFEGRFKSQKLLDETAILACAMYVDLNPIRAELAATPETSKFTSAYERIAARQRRARRQKPGKIQEELWLSPVELDRREQSLVSKSKRRASDRGFLPMTQDQYLELLDWTGRQVRADKRGAIPEQLAPILDRLQVSPSCWVDLIDGYGTWFRRTVGLPSNMAAACKKQGLRWLQGISHARAAFIES